MPNLLINTVVEEGASHCDCLANPSMEEVERRIKKLHKWEDLKGFVFVYGKGSVLQVLAPLSKEKLDSVCKIVTGYYDS